MQIKSYSESFYRFRFQRIFRVESCLSRSVYCVIFIIYNVILHRVMVMFLINCIYNILILFKNILKIYFIFKFTQMIVVFGGHNGRNLKNNDLYQTYQNQWQQGVTACSSGLLCGVFVRVMCEGREMYIPTSLRYYIYKIYLFYEAICVL